MIPAKQIKLLISFLFLSFVVMAQSAGQPEVGMADMMRSNGRIYVVIAVILTILFGLILYIIRLDRKISKLEKQNPE
jgi:uncharacterized membrane protein